MATAVRPVKTRRDSSPAASTIRVGAAVSAATSGRWCTTASARSERRGSSREPSSSVGRPNVAGSAGGRARYSSVISPSSEVIAMKAAMPAPKPRSA